MHLYGAFSYFYCYDIDKSNSQTLDRGQSSSQRIQEYIKPLGIQVDFIFTNREGGNKL